LTRHWKITTSSGEVRRVDGPGVIGKFPILHSGGYVDFGNDGIFDREVETDKTVDETGWFIYQSISGNISSKSTFGGRLTFVINTTGNDMSGGGSCENISSMATFDVVVPTFELKPQEFYF
jgi:uncharacterized protein affecting Mg2+/Co2+ transport